MYEKLAGRSGAAAAHACSIAAVCRAHNLNPVPGRCGNGTVAARTVICGGAGGCRWLDDWIIELQFASKRQENCTNEGCAIANLVFALDVLLILLQHGEIGRESAPIFAGVTGPYVNLPQRVQGIKSSSSTQPALTLPLTLTETNTG